MLSWVPFLPGEVDATVHVDDVARASHCLAAELRERKWAVQSLRIAQENRQALAIPLADTEHPLHVADWSDNEDEKRKFSDSVDHIEIHSRLAKQSEIVGELVTVWGDKVGKTTIKAEFQRDISSIPPAPIHEGEIDFRAVLAHRTKVKLQVELNATNFGIGAPLEEPKAAVEAPAAEGEAQADTTELVAEAAPDAAPEAPAAPATAEAAPTAEAPAANEEAPAEAQAAPEAEADTAEPPKEAEPVASPAAEPPAPQPTVRHRTLKGKVLSAPGMEKETWFPKATPMVVITSGKAKFETSFKKDHDPKKNEWDEEFSLDVEVTEHEGTLVATHPLHVEIRDHSFWHANTTLARAELSIGDLNHAELVSREIALLNDDVAGFVQESEALAKHNLHYLAAVRAHLAKLGWTGHMRWSYGNLDLANGDTTKIPAGFAYTIETELQERATNGEESPAPTDAKYAAWIAALVTNTEGVAQQVAAELADVGVPDIITVEERVTLGGKDSRVQLQLHTAPILKPKVVEPANPAP